MKYRSTLAINSLDSSGSGRRWKTDIKTSWDSFPDDIGPREISISVLGTASACIYNVFGCECEGVKSPQFMILNSLSSNSIIELVGLPVKGRELKGIRKSFEFWDACLEEMSGPPNRLVRFRGHGKKVDSEMSKVIGA
jgi:hypothetical protein